MHVRIVILVDSSITHQPMRFLVECWLREAIRNGQVDAWNRGFPRYVWFRSGDELYEAREGSPGSGKYHEYPLETWQEVQGLR